MTTTPEQGQSPVNMSAPDPHAAYRMEAALDERLAVLEAQVRHYEGRTQGLNCEVRARDLEIAALQQDVDRLRGQVQFHQDGARSLAERLDAMLAEATEDAAPEPPREDLRGL